MPSNQVLNLIHPKRIILHKQSFSVSISVQTPLHFLSPGLVSGYRWNEWDLRRDALSTCRGVDGRRRTRGTQTSADQATETKKLSSVVINRQGRGEAVTRVVREEEFMNAV